MVKKYNSCEMEIGLYQEDLYYYTNCQLNFIVYCMDVGLYLISKARSKIFPVKTTSFSLWLGHETTYWLQPSRPCIIEMYFKISCMYRPNACIYTETFSCKHCTIIFESNFTAVRFLTYFSADFLPLGKL